ncbi:phosphotransferase family protein [Gemella cuniculi]|uniref:phosphotransferase family protein n=1 Tax=Gemella cuniculi TaxID=150240 RepID=UPI000405E5FA|nr:phosphotransferase family protein [Gemella cuniculi]
MSKEYYQMGWTLDEQYEDDYFFSKDNHNYFIKKNTTPMIATLSVEGIVPKLRWTKRISNGDVLIAQDFENGRTLKNEDMRDKRIPEILKKVHSSNKLKRIMKAQGYCEETAYNSLCNLKTLINNELRKNSNIINALNYLENNLPEQNIEYTPCHTDLHKDNWLLSDKGKLFLVDWEHSILGDPAIDISFILYKYIPQKEWNEWLKIYGQVPTIKYRNRLKWYITLQSIIMIVWYHEKRQFSEMNSWLVFLNRIFNEFI